MAAVTVNTKTHKVATLTLKLEDLIALARKEAGLEAGSMVAFKVSAESCGDSYEKGYQYISEMRGDGKVTVEVTVEVPA